MASRMGSKRPRVIATVERAIWNVVFAVARGERDLEEAVQNLAESLPWLEVEAETQNDWISRWFDGKKEDSVSALELGVGETSKAILEEGHGASEVVEEDSVRMDCDSTASVSQLNDAEDDGHSDMDCDLVSTVPQPHPSFSSVEALDISQAESQSLDASSQGVTQLPSSPQLATPSAFRLERPTGREPLFLPDSDDEWDYNEPSTETPTAHGHQVQQALFSDTLNKTTYIIRDNQHNIHTIEVVDWVSVGFTGLFDCDLIVSSECILGASQEYNNGKCHL